MIGQPRPVGRHASRDQRAASGLRSPRSAAALVVAVLAALVVPFILPGAGADGSVRVQPGGEVSRTVSVTLPDVAPLEVLVLVDATGSESAKIGPAVSRIVDAADTAGTPLRIGVAAIGDYPVAPFGAPGDLPYRLVQPLSADPAIWKAALAGVEGKRLGGDPAEGQLGALSEAMRTAYADGGPGFTEGAGKILLVVTDAASHEGSDLGCDERGTCVPYPGPASGDVAALAAELGFRILVAGDIPEGDPLRSFGNVLGSKTDDADPLVPRLLPDKLEIDIDATCESDEVDVAHDPAIVSGLPGETIEVVQTVTATLDAIGPVACEGLPFDALDVLVEISDEPDEEAAGDDKTDEGDDGTKDDGDESEDDKTTDDGDDGKDQADEAGEAAPVVVTIAIQIPAEEWSLDVALPAEVLTALEKQPTTYIEVKSGVLPDNGFDAESANLLDEPDGGLAILDPEAPTEWLFTPAGPGSDWFRYELLAKDGSVLAEIKVVLLIAEDKPADDEPDDGKDEPEVVTSDDAEAPEGEEAKGDETGNAGEKAAEDTGDVDKTDGEKADDEKADGDGEKADDDDEKADEGDAPKDGDADPKADDGETDPAD